MIRIQHRVLCSRDSRSLLASGSLRSEGPGPAGHELGGSGVGQDRLGPVFEPGATDGGAGRARPAVGESQLPAADAAGHATSTRLPAAIAGTVSDPEIPRAASPRDHREWEVMSEIETNPKRLRRHPPDRMPLTRRGALASLVGAAVAPHGLDGDQAKPPSPGVPWLAEVQRPPAKLPADAPRLTELLVGRRGRPIKTRAGWRRRRRELLRAWRTFLGPAPYAPIVRGAHRAPNLY